MIYSTMIRDYIGNQVIDIGHHSQDIMRSMVQSLAVEIVQDLDQDGDLHVTW